MDFKDDESFWLSLKNLMVMDAVHNHPEILAQIQDCEDPRLFCWSIVLGVLTREDAKKVPHFSGALH